MSCLRILSLPMARSDGAHAEINFIEDSHAGR
jgi:hypothetical protein